MKDKQWYESKTVWSAIIIATVGILRAYKVDVPIEVLDSVLYIAGAFGMFGVRDAVGKMKR